MLFTRLSAVLFQSVEIREVLETSCPPAREGPRSAVVGYIKCEL